MLTFATESETQYIMIYVSDTRRQSLFKGGIKRYIW